MLLFKPEHVASILAGRKTQTRRLWAKPRVKVGSVYQARLAMLNRDSTFAHLRIKRLWRMGALDEITEEDARAEGYGSVDAFLEAFRRINHWLPGQVGVTGKTLHAVEFEALRQETMP